MKKILSLAFLATLFLSVSCVKGEKFADESLMKAPGVYGYLDPIASDDDPATKATVDPATMQLGFELGDNINIWSSKGTLVIYSVEEITAGGGASFDGGGFTLTDGETYYSSYPLIASFKDKLRSLTTTYEGQVQTADGDPSHVADFTYTYASSPCTNGSASFAYHYLCRWLRFQLTLPKTMVVTELTVTADSEVFTLDGKVDVTTGTFTPGKMSDTMTLKFKNVRVSDGVLNAFMAHAPYEACNIVVSVKDKDGNVYSTPVVAQAAATNLGKYRTITQTLTEDSSAGDAVARIGLVTYPSLAAAVAAVPTDGTPTTITMIGDETITGDSGIEIGSGQNIILDLNGHTISHSDPEGETNRLLLNYGTLTIKDSSDSAKDGSGSGKIIVDPGPGTGVYEYGIANAGVLNIESGYFEMGGTQAGSSVINNELNFNTTITGGKFNGYAYGVRMSLNSTSTDNILNVGGTAVFEGNIGIYVEYANGNANRGDLNITGGTFNTTGRAVYSAEYNNGTTFNATGLSVNISGGTFGGRGVALNAFSPLRSISVSGGHFASFTLQAAGGIKFITGGEFESVTEMIKLHFPDQTPIADGYKAVYENDLYIVVPESDPRPAVSIFPDNMIAYKWEGGSWYGFNFYEPFEGPNILLCTDEYIALVMDINLTRDVTYVQSADWCTPIFQGGTFYLRFGDFDIHLNGYAFPLPTGVSVKTDRQTDIFTALAEGATVTVTEISEEEYHYVYSVTQQTEPVIDEPGQW